MAYSISSNDQPARYGIAIKLLNSGENNDGKNKIRFNGLEAVIKDRDDLKALSQAQTAEINTEDKKLTVKRIIDTIAEVARLSLEASSEKDLKKLLEPKNQESLLRVDGSMAAGVYNEGATLIKSDYFTGNMERKETVKPEASGMTYFEILDPNKTDEGLKKYFKYGEGEDQAPTAFDLKQAIYDAVQEKLKTSDNNFIKDLDKAKIQKLINVQLHNDGDYASRASALEASTSGRLNLKKKNIVNLIMDDRWDNITFGVKYNGQTGFKTQINPEDCVSPPLFQEKYKALEVFQDNLSMQGQHGQQIKSDYAYKSIANGAEHDPAGATAYAQRFIYLNGQSDQEDQFGSLKECLRIINSTEEEFKKSSISTMKNSSEINSESLLELAQGGDAFAQKLFITSAIRAAERVKHRIEKSKDPENDKLINKPALISITGEYASKMFAIPGVLKAFDRTVNADRKQPIPVRIYNPELNGADIINKQLIKTKT
ncbi:MAG: hypothetical protein VKK32_01375 [Candidatus Melainabacteria bacterium]|nr:hypothetical protein [Candidatus Melainabacteria bacterium]